MSALTTLAPPIAIDAAGVTFRRWRGLEEIPAMVVANNELRRRCGIIQHVTGDSMRHRYAHLVNCDPTEDCVLIEHRGVTQGYARIEWHDLADGDRVYEATLLVAPALWGTGAAAVAVRWLEGRAAELAAAHPTDRRSFVGHYVFGGDTESESALLAAGYEAVRWDAELLRPDLEDIGPEALPHGYEIRTPSLEELPIVFEMYVTAFQEHWGEAQASDQRIEEWVEDPKFRRDLQVVVWKGAQPAAGVHNSLDAQADGSVWGLLASVATHPAHRRLGLARAAINHSLRLIRDAGATAAYLGVDTGNHNRAMELYESCGFRQTSSGTNYRKALDAHGGRR